MIYLLDRNQIISHSVNKSERHPVLSEIAKFISISIDIHFEHMVHRIYPAEPQLNKANDSDTLAAFSDLNLSIHNDIVLQKQYMINGMILILILLIFCFLMTMSLDVPPMVYIYTWKKVKEHFKPYL